MQNIETTQILYSFAKQFPLFDWIPNFFMDGVDETDYERPFPAAVNFGFKTSVFLLEGYKIILVTLGIISLYMLAKAALACKI